MTGTFTAVYKKIDDMWIDYIEEITGVNTQGDTLEEARENLKEAFELIIQTNKELMEKEFSNENTIKEDLLIAF
jgi:predicted RNase H-like HicB family nuclease